MNEKISIEEFIDENKEFPIEISIEFDLMDILNKAERLKSQLPDFNYKLDAIKKLSQDILYRKYNK